MPQGNPERPNQEETAATTLFSIILGRFNVICLTPAVDMITGQDARTPHHGDSRKFRRVACEKGGAPIVCLDSTEEDAQ